MIAKKRKDFFFPSNAALCPLQALAASRRDVIAGQLVAAFSICRIPAACFDPSSHHVL